MTRDYGTSPPLSPPCQDGGNRVTEALNSQQQFSREQVAYLMHTAFRWGYEHRDQQDRGFWAGYQARVAEENAAWRPDDRVFQARATEVGVNQRVYRRQCDAAARLPRPGDHRGGPAPMWGDDISGLQVAA